MKEKLEETPLSKPSEEFINWWPNHDHARKQMLDKGRLVWNGKTTAEKAWLIADYRDEFRARKHENAAGTGVNYAYFGWWRSHTKPRMSYPTILEEHRAWCKAHNRPDPLKEDEYGVPDAIRNAKTFDAAKGVLRLLSDKMDMNKAIGWTEADSAAANRQPGEQPF
jgi:hypothetical protein